MTKRINDLSDDDFKRHLRVFIKAVPIYIPVLDLTLEEVESLNRQYLAFSWALEVKEKLAAYTKSINTLLRELKTPLREKVSTVYFMDIPRPPVFFTEGNIYSTFELLIKRVKNSQRYTSTIGIELGIDRIIG